MGYASVRPPGLGTYPSIETSRSLRWSAFEECGVRQVRSFEEWPMGAGRPNPRMQGFGPVHGAPPLSPPFEMELAQRSRRF